MHYNYNQLGKKGTFGTMIQWLIATFIVIIVCIIVVALVFAVASRGGKDMYEQARVFPERAFNLYSILNLQINNINVDKLLLEDRLKYDEKTEIINRIPIIKGDYGNWVLALGVCKAGDFLNDKKAVCFPLLSDKKLNARFYFAPQEVAYA